MKKEGIWGRSKRKFKATTNSKHSLPVAPNLLNRDFTAQHPDQLWAGDISYIRTEEGWLYLSVIMDLYSRRIVGWAMRDRLTQELAIDALQMALRSRRPSPDLIHHSDRGSQYASHAYQKLLSAYGIRSSMSRKGDCYDNAVVESFFGTLKTEWVYHHRYRTRQEAMLDIFEYIEVFYNRKRLHSYLGNRSPVEMEELALAA
jgi:transposase InsO family protein